MKNYILIIFLIISLNSNCQLPYYFVKLNVNTTINNPLLEPIDTSGIDVFILWWQSNAEGIGYNDSVTESSVYKDYIGDTLYGYIFRTINDKWDTLSIIHSMTQSYWLTRHGPDIAFAVKYWKTYNKPCYIIKHAVGGTPIRDTIGGYDWNTGNQGELFDILFRNSNSIINSAKDSLNNNGINYNIVGILGVGGEQDSYLSNQIFYSDFSKFIDSTRNYTQQYCPHIFNRMSSGWGLISENIYNNFISIQQNKINCRYVNSDDLLYQFDNVHFTTYSLKILGERMFDQWKYIIDNMNR